MEELALNDYLCVQLLGPCLAHHRDSINICCMVEGKAVIRVCRWAAGRLQA